MGNRSLLQKLGVALGILANPWMLLLDKVGLVKKPVYRTKTGVKFETRGGTTDINDAVVVLSGKEYPPELVGLNGIANPVVLDCGGHIGTFSMYIKSHWPTATILALEPVADNQQLFRHNIELNNFSNVDMMPNAIYDEHGRFYIDLAGKQFDAVSVTREKPPHDQFITIDALTFDEIIAAKNLQWIDLMKLDIEGAEYNLFAKSAAQLAQNVGRIIMEFHPAGDKAKRDELVNYLAGKFELVYETKNILGFDNIAKNEIKRS